MRSRLDGFIGIGKKLGLDEEKGFAVAIFLVLLVVSVTVIGYYVWLKPPAEPYNSIYLLDSQKNAGNYPDVLIANQNSTFNVFVNVVNHLGGTNNQTYRVEVKITSSLSTLPVDAQPIQTYDLSIKDGVTWQNQATITENQVGSYSVVFELWQQNSDGTYVFTNNYCDLNIKVIS